MADAKNILYVQTSNLPERQYSPLVLAQSAKAMGLDAAVYYLGMGLTVLKPGAAEEMQLGKFPSVAEMLQKTLGMGITVYVCEASKQMLGWEKVELIEGVKIVGAATLNDLALTPTPRCGSEAAAVADDQKRTLELTDPSAALRATASSMPTTSVPSPSIRARSRRCCRTSQRSSATPPRCTAWATRDGGPRRGPRPGGRVLQGAAAPRSSSPAAPPRPATWRSSATPCATGARATT